MLRLAAGVAVSFLFAFTAWAQSPADDPKALLHNAVENAAEHAKTRYAFTMEFWTKRNDDEPISFRARFDPRLPEGERWRLLDDAETALGKDAEKVYEKLREREAGDDQLIYDSLGDMLDDATLSEETAEEAVFTAPVKEKGVPEDKVEMAITLNKTSGYVSRIDVRALEAFKPNPAVKLHALEQTQLYAPLDSGGPAFLQSGHSKSSGKAMFKSFEAETRTSYSDVEAVDVPPAE